MSRTVVFVGLLLIAAACQAQTCLHGPDESREEQARRAAAVRFVQRVNDAELVLRGKEGRFDNLFNLRGVDAPPVGFVPRVTFDSWSYTIVAKDTFDPCRFSLFSDQDGIIYEGRPVAGSGPASSARRSSPAPHAATRHNRVIRPRSGAPRHGGRLADQIRS